MRFWLWELAVEMPRPYRLITGIALCAAGWGISNSLSFLLWIGGLGFLAAALFVD